MSAREIVALGLLLGGVVIGLLAALALVPLRSAFDRLHLLGPVGTVGIALIVSAIVVREGFSATGAKAILAGGLIFIMSPIVTHMTARARWHGGLRRRRGWHGEYGGTDGLDQGDGPATERRESNG